MLLQSILNPYRQARLTMMCPLPLDGDSTSLEQLMLKVAELFIFEEENYLTVGVSGINCSLQLISFLDVDGVREYCRGKQHKEETQEKGKEQVGSMT